MINIYPMDLRCYAKAQCEEMQKHRGIESEKAGRDLGDGIYLEWIKKYAKLFRENWDRLSKGDS
jgi:hypothetical protein